MVYNGLVLIKEKLVHETLVNLKCIILKKKSGSKATCYIIPFMWNSGESKTTEQKIVQWAHHVWFERWNNDRWEGNGILEEMVYFLGNEKLTVKEEARTPWQHVHSQADHFSESTEEHWGSKHWSL